MKRILLIALIWAVAGWVSSAVGEWGTKSALADARANAPQAQPSPVRGPAASLPAETLLKIRDLQLAQAKRTLQMKAMELAYQKLQDDQDADTQSIDAIVRDAAKRTGVDLQKFVFDIRTSRFIPREKPAAPGK
jgi:hypothetical protein